MGKWPLAAGQDRTPYQLVPQRQPRHRQGCEVVKVIPYPPSSKLLRHSNSNDFHWLRISDQTRFSGSQNQVVSPLSSFDKVYGTCQRVEMGRLSGKNAIITGAAGYVLSENVRRACGVTKFVNQD